MNLDNEDKQNIYFISILFIVVILLSLYSSFLRQPVHSFFNDITKDIFPIPDELVKNMSNNYNKGMDEITKNKSTPCFLCGDDISDSIQKKFEESGLMDFFESDNYNIERPSNLNLPSFSEIDINFSSSCTNIFTIEESSKYSKYYKYTMSNTTMIHIFEKYKGKVNDFYVFETISEMTVGSSVYFSNIENYYLPDGTCVLSYYSVDGYMEKNKIDCSGNYEVFLCEEFLNQLNYTGEERYSTTSGNYDVYVYSNEDESIVVKYGKHIPVLFYLKYDEGYNKNMVIELLKVDGVNYG